MKKIILINPREKTIELVEVENIYPDANKLMECQTFTSADYFAGGPNADEHTLMVDDEGLYVSDKYWFRFNNGPRPFCGISVIVGPADDEGETLDVTCTVEEVKKLVIFDGTFMVR